MSAKRLAGRSNRRNEVRIARGLDDLLMVYTIRASVYMADRIVHSSKSSMATIIALRISSDSFVGNLPDVFVCGFLVTLLSLSASRCVKASDVSPSHSTWFALVSTLPDAKGLRASMAIPAKG
jgi:hypothetical protein